MEFSFRKISKEPAKRLFPNRQALEQSKEELKESMMDHPGTKRVTIRLDNVDES